MTMILSADENIINESLLDDIESVADVQSSERIAADSQEPDKRWLTSPEWYKHWDNQGYYYLFLIELPLYPQVDFAEEFYKMDAKIRTMFEYIQNIVRTSELVAVSYYDDPTPSERSSSQWNVINNGDLLLEPAGIKDVGIDRWVSSKYFYKFCACAKDLRWVKRLLKLFAIFGNICEETKN